MPAGAAFPRVGRRRQTRAGSSRARDYWASQTFRKVLLSYTVGANL